MITGHIGVAYGAKARWRDTSLWWLLFASVAPDVVDIASALAGVCNPAGLYSHTLPALAVIAAAVAGASWLQKRNGATAMLAAALVLLHLPLDFVTGVKYLWPGGAPIGLYLYRWPVLDFLLEVPIVVTGWYFFRRAGAAPKWLGSATVILALVILQASLNFTQHETGRTKPSACAVEKN